MLAQNTTRDAIVEAFISAVESSSLKKVRVASLIDELGINRNTFYYHFGNKYDVAMYVFRTDLDKVLKDELHKYEWVSSPLVVSKKNVDLVYYSHVEIGAHTLDMTKFYKALVHCMFSRERFYHNLLNVHEPEFYGMLVDLFIPAVRDDITFMLGGRYMPEATFELLTRENAELVVFPARYCLIHHQEIDELLNDTTNPFWNLSYEGLTSGLTAHPISRPRRR